MCLQPLTNEIPRRGVLKRADVESERAEPVHLVRVRHFFSAANSWRASIRVGIPESASFQKAKNSWYALAAPFVSPAGVDQTTRVVAPSGERVGRGRGAQLRSCRCAQPARHLARLLKLTAKRQRVDLRVREVTVARARTRRVRFLTLHGRSVALGERDFVETKTSGMELAALDEALHHRSRLCEPVQRRAASVLRMSWAPAPPARHRAGVARSRRPVGIGRTRTTGRFSSPYGPGEIGEKTWRGPQGFPPDAGPFCRKPVSETHPDGSRP